MTKHCMTKIENLPTHHPFGVVTGNDNTKHVFAQQSSKANDIPPTSHPELVAGSITKGRHVAFTLAEVLITLAVIGIVAALTIPALVNQNKQRAWNTASDVFQKKLEVAMKVMNTQETLAGYSSTEDFVNELSKHLKITKICDNSDLQSCFEDTVYFGTAETEISEVDMTSIKKAKDLGQKDWGTNIVGIQLSNGVTGLVAYNPDCTQDPYNNQYNPTGCVAVLYDTSGFTKPNTSNKDLRALNVTKLGKTCAFKIGETCFGTPFTPGAMTYAKCTGIDGATAENVAEAGAYAKSLGIKECYAENDYWAGAVEACGGTSNLPTSADLAKLAEKIYPTIGSIDAEGWSNCPNGSACWQTDVANSYGFNTSKGYFYVWSGEECNSFRAYYRYFDPGYTGWLNGYRSASSLFAVCLGD